MSAYEDFAGLYDVLMDDVDYDAWAASTAPPGFPVVLEEHEPVVRTLTRGTEKPTEEEILENRRASSAKVRAVEKIRTSRTPA